MTDYKPKAFAVHFPRPPANGTKIFIKGDEFELVGSEPYTRADGESSSILTWIGYCQSCGIEFHQTTGKSFSSFKRNCAPCRTDFMDKRKSK